ncbi:hypothetical protein J1C67_10320 [Clostridium gasigenes]|uniref:hypothetical protein n=1 Tax=Clostridium gasigenes TaxID=94869 RepID=UPI0014383EA2|nr:hypothetical protein [Clostridium gasigenes]NKF07540.1 hypothetical protein [Clostridium gasigenes]QSW17975.1 hypothetical protein J1C67_10320 [Clostridium gasigenes]
MRESIEMPKKIFYLIVGICSAIIMLTSIDIILRAKDTELFNMWLSKTNSSQEFLMKTTEELFSEYLQMNISIFMVRAVTPMGIAIHAYFTFTKLRVNKLYVVLWSLISIGTFLLTSLGEQFYSIFFIMSGICYFILIAIMSYLGKCIYNLRSI